MHHRPFSRLSRRLLTSLSRTLPACPIASASSVVAILAYTSFIPTAYAIDSVGNFGSNPGQLSMFTHVPDVNGPIPLVLVLHGCTQNRGYADAVGMLDFADSLGFAVAIAEQPSSNNQNTCFNWFETGDIARGSGEAASLKSMVDFMINTYDIDTSQIYVTGLSAGGAMTTVMLATYPDVFAAGAIFAGTPYRCGTGFVNAFSCMGGNVTKTQNEWATLVENATNHNGPWPRILAIHGKRDNTVNQKNADDIALQWTGVHGLAAAATSSSTGGGVTRSFWREGGQNNGTLLVETIKIDNMDHGTPVDPNDGCGTAGAFVLNVGLCGSLEALDFFGLTGNNPVDPVEPDAGIPDAGTPDAGQDAGQDAGPNPDGGNNDGGNPDGGNNDGGVVYSETFSDLDGNGDGYDQLFWVSDASIENDAAHLVAESSGLGNCGEGTVTASMLASREIPPNSILQFTRSGSLSSLININTTASFQVLASGVVVHDETVTFENASLDEQTFTIPFANASRTLEFVVKANSNVCITASADIVLDDIFVISNAGNPQNPDPLDGGNNPVGDDGGVSPNDDGGNNNNPNNPDAGNLGVSDGGIDAGNDVVSDGGDNNGNDNGDRVDSIGCEGCDQTSTASFSMWAAFLGMLSFTRRRRASFFGLFGLK